MKKIKVLLLIFLVLLAGCSTKNLDYVKAEKLLEYQSTKYDSWSASGILENKVRTINIKAYQFYFEPTTIVVNKGEKLKLIIESMDVPHGFEIEGFQIPGYDINTKIMKGTPLVLEFDANEKGVWEFICTIYCGFGHGTMKGKFVVR